MMKLGPIDDVDRDAAQLCRCRQCPQVCLRRVRTDRHRAARQQRIAEPRRHADFGARACKHDRLAARRRAGADHQCSPAGEVEERRKVPHQ